MMVLVILACGALFLKDDPNLDALAALTVVALVLLLGLFLIGICISVKQRLTPRPFYDFFICHHKAHAAAQARLLKIILQSRKHYLQVFVDSDDLKQIDTLFDTVKSRLRHLVVYLTAETLRRPWCVGEVVSATWAKIRITRVLTPSFSPVPEEKLQDPESYVESLGCNLSEYGIQWVHVTEAFRALFSSTKCLELNVAAPGSDRFEQVAAELLSQRPQPREARQLGQCPPAKVILSTDRDSDEANAAASILVAALSEPVFELCSERICVLADYIQDMEAMRVMVQQATAVILLLTGSCLETEECLRVLCELQICQGSDMPAAAIPVNTADFAFPSAKLFAKMQKYLPLVFAEYGEDLTIEYVRAFFKNISIFYPTHASQEALDTQSAEELRRVRQACSLVLPGTSSRGPMQSSSSGAGKAQASNE
eukprot:1419844-Amphidinium_carterae.1